MIRLHLGAAIVAAVLAHGISVALIALLLRRRNLLGDRAPGGALMRYPRGWHYLAWAMLAVPLSGLGFLAWYFPPKPEDLGYFLALLAGFGGVGAYLVVEVSGVAHELQPGGLLFVSPWGQRRFLPWSELTALHYSPVRSAFRIWTASGSPVSVAIQLSGVGSFASAVLQGVPAEVIDRAPRVRSMLTELAAGRSRPSEWW